MAMERIGVVEELERWLGLGHARLGVRATATGYEGLTQGAGLFGALGLQLLLVVTRSEGFALCRGCSLPFTPTSRHRTYCPDCGADERAMARRRQARRRARPRST
jgi:hypothetical protein